MFGYVIASREILTEKQLKRYKSCYCGLCRAIKERHGSLARAALTYDMTFLLILLSSLYEPEETGGEERCLIHPLKRHVYSVSDISAYAADMNIALAYFNCRDDWEDDRNFLRLAESGVLKRHYAEIEASYPRQCGTIVSCMDKLSELERQNIKSPDAGANIFGRLMGELFVLYEDDHWSPVLRCMGEALGRFIYIMDASLDLRSDIKHGKYNPLADSESPGTAPRDMKGVLTALIGESAAEFEKLPLVQDIDILRNIIYSGVWQRYNLALAKKGGAAEEKGET